MDPLTQGAIGAVAATAAFGHRLPRSAWLIGLAGGMAADLDIFLRVPGDPMMSVALHRHFTHALAFIPLGGLIVAAPFLLVGARTYRGHRWAVIAAATIAYATHGLLDACTSYGTLLLWPFSDRRIAWDCMSIVDPVFTLLLLVGLVAAIVMRKATPSRAAMAMALIYILFGAVQQQRAVQAQHALAQARGHIIERGRVMPTLGNLIIWRSVYICEGRLWTDAVRTPLGRSTMVRPGDSVARASIDALKAQADPGLGSIDRSLRLFAWFADGYIAAIPDPATLADLRYSSTPEGLAPLWGLRLVRTERGNAAHTVSLRSPDSAAIASLWRDLFHPHDWIELDAGSGPGKLNARSVSPGDEVSK